MPLDLIFLLNSFSWCLSPLSVLSLPNESSDLIISFMVWKQSGGWWWWRRGLEKECNGSPDAQLGTSWLALSDCGSSIHKKTQSNSLNVWCEFWWLTSPLRNSTIATCAGERRIPLEGTNCVFSRKNFCHGFIDKPGFCKFLTSWYNAFSFCIASRSCSEEFTQSKCVWESCFSRRSHKEFFLRWFKCFIRLYFSWPKFLVKQMVTHCTKLWSVVSYRCDFFLIQLQDGNTNLIWQVVLNPVFTAQTYRVDCTPVSYLRFLSFRPSIHLIEERSNTWTPGVLMISSLVILRATLSHSPSK